MARTTKKIYGPIATDSDAWPPPRRGNIADQERLELLLDKELTAYQKAISADDWVTEVERTKLETSDRRQALARAEQEDMTLLRQFLANSTGPDGKKIGKEIPDLYVKPRDRAKSEKLPADHWHVAQTVQPVQKKTEAVWEAGRAKAILELVYGRTPDGYLPRTDLIVAAKRSGLSQDEIKDWKRNKACPKDPWLIWPPTSSPPTVRA
jgi:hypothetical protein